MTPTTFRAWRARLGLTQAEAAAMLGIGYSTLRLYEHGQRWETGQPVPIPKLVRLAMDAVERDMTARD